MDALVLIRGRYVTVVFRAVCRTAVKRSQGRKITRHDGTMSHRDENDQMDVVKCLKCEFAFLHNLQSVLHTSTLGCPEKNKY